MGKLIDVFTLCGSMRKLWLSVILRGGRPSVVFVSRFPTMRIHLFSMEFAVGKLVTSLDG